MKRTVLIIGSIIFALLMYAIPILTVCSFVYGWDGFIKTVLSIFVIGQIAVFCELIYSAAEEDK